MSSLIGFIHCGTYVQSFCAGWFSTYSIVVVFMAVTLDLKIIIEFRIHAIRQLPDLRVRMAFALLSMY